MKITRVIGKAFKPLVNFPSWMGWKEISGTGKNISTLAKSTFSVKQATHQETFEEAMQRLRLSEADLVKRGKTFLQLSIFYGLLGLGLLIYALYLVIFQGYILSGFTTFVLAVLGFTLAYREHFWYFQIKTRSLGNRFKDWYHFVSKGSKHE